MLYVWKASYFVVICNNCVAHFRVIEASGYCYVSECHSEKQEAIPIFSHARYKNDMDGISGGD